LTLTYHITRDIYVDRLEPKTNLIKKSVLQIVIDFTNKTINAKNSNIVSKLNRDALYRT